MIGGGRNVGGIRFQDHGIKGQGAGDGPNSGCPVVGDGTAEADQKTQLYIFPGLLQTAAEGVNDTAAAKSLLAYGRLNLVVGLADVQEQGQVIVGGDIELCLEKLLLNAMITIFDVIIQTDFTQGDDLACGCYFRQFVQMGGQVTGKIHGVQAGSGEEIGMSAAQMQKIGPEVAADAGEDLGNKPRFSAALEHRIEIAGETFQIQMVVGIDQLHVMRSCYTSISTVPIRAARVATVSIALLPLSKNHYQPQDVLMPMLAAITAETHKNIDSTVIWLHGLGADGNDFAPIVPELRLPEDMGVRFIFPHAPSIPVTINGGCVMPAWYDILDMEIDRRLDVEQLRMSADLVREFIDVERQRGVACERIIVAGFSQGGAVAYETALSYPSRLGGLLAMSTYFATEKSIQLHSANRELAIEIHHGIHDEVVPPRLGKKALEALKKKGYTAHYREYGMQHGVCAEQIDDISAWLQARLG